MGTLDLSWDSNSKHTAYPAVSYIVQWKKSGQEYSTDRQATPTTNSYTLVGDQGTAYTVRVRATMTTRPVATGPRPDRHLQQSRQRPGGQMERGHGGGRHIRRTMEVERPEL